MRCNIMKNKKINLLVVVGTVVLVVNIARAEPVYLDCFTVLDKLPKQQFSVKLDEETGEITHTDPYNGFKTHAFYGPDQITYQQYNPEGFGMMTYRKFIINRSTLLVTEFATIKSTTTQKLRSFTSLGSCSAAVVDDTR